MSFTPTAGPVALLKTAPVAGTAGTVPGINWKLDIDAKLKDVSNFRDGRFNAPTLQDCDASFTLVWDAAAMPHSPSGAGVIPGADITGKFYTDATNFYNGVFTISKVHPGVDSLEDVVMYPVEGKIKGTLTPPITT